MFLILIIVILAHFFMCGPRINKNMLGGGEYLSRERTNMINGFFIWIVFINHMRSYKLNLGPIDHYIAYEMLQIGQCCVATFFFYSGFGLMNSLKNKGVSYNLSLITKRIPRLLCHMAFAIALYWILQTLYGKSYDVSKVLLSCIGWESLGNSNWFIFITLVSYVFIFIGYVAFHKLGNSAVVLSVTILLLLLISILKGEKGTWWYDTCLCIPAGMAFCLYRHHIEAFIKKLRIPLWILGLCLIPLSIHVYLSGALHKNFLFFISRPHLQNMAAITFAFGITLLFSCITLNRMPKFLVWSGGVGLFWLYILQRIPMIIGAHEKWQISHVFLYQLFCIVFTIASASFISKAINQIDNYISKLIKFRNIR